MAWGVEGRVPFLDKDFIDIAMNLNPIDKMNIKVVAPDKSTKETNILSYLEKLKKFLNKTL